MRKLTVPLLAVAYLLIGCDSPTNMPTALKVPTLSLAVGNGNGVQHRVSVGSHDFSDPGQDANFSLIAIQKADGSVSGQWEDKFGPGDGVEGGYHIAVDCVSVQGNRAWIGGVVTKALNEALIGTRAFTEVEDNGTSANDPPDKISYSYAGYPVAYQCQHFVLPLFALSGGEVKVD
jgi:hypothetical protein